MVSIILMSVFSSFAEVFSIGILIPFLSALTNPKKILDNHSLESIFSVTGIAAAHELIFALMIVFIISVVVAGILRLLLLWGNSKISFYIGAELSTEIYRRCLYQPYTHQINQNSSEVVTAILSKVDAVIFGVISPILVLISSIIVLITILIALLLISPWISLTIFGVVGGLYLLISLMMRKQLMLNSRKAAGESNKLAKMLQESFGGIRDILLGNTQEVYCASFKNAAFNLRKSQGSSFFIGQSPRLILEMLGMVVIAIVAYMITSLEAGLLGAVPILGAMALAAQRLLPTFQQIYSSWVSLRSNNSHLKDILKLMSLKAPNQLSLNDLDIKMSFDEFIKLDNVSYSYRCDSKIILNEINLKIYRGEKIGIIGLTGGGKSTLLDLIMGLLEPTSGSIYIDNIQLNSKNCSRWQRRITHVPQGIFLSDSSVAQNIAFGVPSNEIDYRLVKAAADMAQISSEIESWKEGYRTVIGERGIRLSGGQRQRIGIARAFYKKADVIILDEATSALDLKTEEMVIHALEKTSDKFTIFMVAHRLSTLKNCDRVIEISDGHIKRIGTYQEMI
ncbi:ABC transporter ATP-binding protein [Polynucleobacter sp. HIN8]|nr:ABC transporter ATP-binding protein [Polynucleobacter sp. HIN8]